MLSTLSHCSQIRVTSMRSCVTKKSVIAVFRKCYRCPTLLAKHDLAHAFQKIDKE